jgi:hypothetical protein
MELNSLQEKIISNGIELLRLVYEINSLHPPAEKEKNRICLALEYPNKYFFNSVDEAALFLKPIMSTYLNDHKSYDSYGLNFHLKLEKFLPFGKGYWLPTFRGHFITRHDGGFIKFDYPDWPETLSYFNFKDIDNATEMALLRTELDQATDGWLRYLPKTYYLP